MARKLRLLRGRVASLPVGRKLMLIYLLGIFVPLVVTNGLVLRSVLQDVRTQENAFLKAVINGMRDGISREFEPIELASEFVYADSAIYRLLSESYTSFEDFVAAHRDYLIPALTKYVSVFTGISRLIIYTNNHAVTVSEGYLGIDDYIRSSVWFTRFSGVRDGLVTMVHRDDDPRADLTTTTYISLFRELDNSSIARSVRMILRIDAKPEVFVRHLQSTELKGHIEVVDPWGTVAARKEYGPTLGSPYTFSFPIDRSPALNGWTIRGTIEPRKVPRPWSERWTLLLITSGMSMAITSLLILLLSRSVTSRLRSVSAQMRRVEHEDFSALRIDEESNDEIGGLINDFNIMARKIDTLINDGYKSEIERQRLLVARQQAELDALQSQVNPHFLYNVLESIRMKSHIRGEKDTALVIKKLSRAFRRLSNWSDDLIPLEEEMRFTREYLEIQQYRFADRLNARISMPSSANEFRIPKLTIQSLVENACVHGLESRTDGGTVSVEVTREHDELQITVADDGMGCDAAVVRARLRDDPPDSRHIGIANLYRRLHLHFGKTFRFEFESCPGSGTTVRIAFVLHRGDTGKKDVSAPSTNGRR